MKEKIIRSLTSILIFSTLLSPGRCLASDTQITEAVLKEKIKRFAKIGEGVYRSSQPSEEAYPLLKEFGIRTVVNFRHEEDRISEEQSWTESQGMRYVSIPWKIYDKTDPEIMKKFFSVIEEPANKPVLFHCRRGVERTGVASVLYQMKFGGKSKKEAEETELSPYPVNLIWKHSVKKRINEFAEALNV